MAASKGSKATKPVAITAHDLKAETGNFRDGYVAAFRKHEGAPVLAENPDGTVKLDKDGNPVQVKRNGQPIVWSQKEFCRVMGISRPSFIRWLDPNAVVEKRGVKPLDESIVRHLEALRTAAGVDLERGNDRFVAAKYTTIEKLCARTLDSIEGLQTKVDEGDESLDGNVLAITMIAMERVLDAYGRRSDSTASTYAEFGSLALSA